MADWGWDGAGDRGLEFPENGEQVGVSPSGRARFRNNTKARQVELSIDGAAYTPLALSGGGSGPLAQASWFIDATAGDDGNDGATAATALASFGE